MPLQAEHNRSRNMTIESTTTKGAAISTRTFVARLLRMLTRELGAFPRDPYNGKA